MHHFSRKNAVWAVSSLLLAVAIQTSAHAAPVAAKSADSFVASIGVHNVPKLDTTKRDLFVNSGIRVSRSTPETQADFDQVKYLTDRGIKCIVAIQPGTSVRPDATFYGKDSPINGNAPFNVVDYVKKIGVSNVLAVEMNNELDNGFGRNFKWHPTDTQNIDNDPNSPLYWAKYARAATQATSAALRSDAATQNIPLLGPSLTSEASYAAAGDLSSWINYSNIHHYMGGRQPETGGWGDNGYGSIPWTINFLSAKQNVANPSALATTEGGNATADSNTTNNQWSLEAHGKYIPRFYFSHFNAGYKWTCTYRFEDFNTGSSDSEENYGLIKSDGTPKPAYNALKNLLGLLSDPGAAFTPTSLDYTPSGNTADVQTTLLQKRDGTFYLAIWLGKQSWNWRETDGSGNVTKTPGPITVAPQNVSLALPSSITSAGLYTLDDNGAMSSATLPIAGNSVALTVTDRVSVVRLNSNSTSLRTPENPANAVNGIDYKYYEGTWSQLPDFAALSSVKSGTLANFSLTSANRADNFGFCYTGYVEVPTDGTYTFTTNSDDGSKLFIGTTEVANNDGLHGAVEKSGTIGLKAGKHLFKVVFFEATGGEVLQVSYAGPGITKQLIPDSKLWRVNTGSGNGTGLKGEYFNGTNFNTILQSRTDATVNFDWGTGAPSGIGSIGVDNFSVRWSGQVQAIEGGTYTFTTTTDDGVRLWVNGVLLVDKWQPQGPTDWSGTISLVAGQKYDIKMEYYEAGGGAVAKLSWTRPGQASQIVPQSQLYPSATQTPPTNLLANPSFDAEAFDTQTPSGWSEWEGDANSNAIPATSSYTETFGGSNSGARHGAHYKTSAYKVYTYQTRTGLANGLYTLRAYARRSGTQTYCQLSAKDFGSAEKTATIPVSSSYQLVTITDINVSNGSCTIGVYSDAGANDWVYFDDLELIKQ